MLIHPKNIWDDLRAAVYVPGTRVGVLKLMLLRLLIIAIGLITTPLWLVALAVYIVERFTTDVTRRLVARPIEAAAEAADRVIARIHARVSLDEIREALGE